MNCFDNEFVCSVKKENNLGYYRLHTIWKKDGFLLNVASENGAWRGEMTPHNIAEMSCHLEMEPESYMKQCKEALTCHGGRPGFVYSVENGYFAWKKLEDEDSGIKIKMGSLMLKPASFVDTIQNLVTAALNCNKQLQDKLKEVSENKEKLGESNNELKNLLKKLVKTKETMENDLYSKFVLLLNSKKKKIQELEDLIEEYYSKQSKIMSKSKNPYEVDTSSDSEQEILKRKTCRKLIASSNEVPESKKMKKVNENLSENTNEVLVKGRTESYSVPGTSKDLDICKELKKDEFDDFFMEVFE